VIPHDSTHAARFGLVGGMEMGANRVPQQKWRVSHIQIGDNRVLSLAQLLKHGLEFGFSKKVFGRQFAKCPLLSVSPP
jgi:hypothetical protein